MCAVRQLPLDLGHVAGQSRDDLIVTRANAAAVELIDRWPAWPAPIMILAGPPGSGKSHLATIWVHEAGARAIGRNMVEAAVQAHVAGPFLVEDADAIDRDEIGLFHLINAVRSSGSSLLLTARRFPAAWGVELPDLASRLKAAGLVELKEPDDELLAGVIAKLFADRQVEVEPHVVQYIARRIERSLDTAIAVVDRLDRAAWETKSRITRGLAAQIVAAFDEGQRALDV